MMSTLEQHLASFVPDMTSHLELARWAVARADEGDWFSTRAVGNSIINVAAAVEKLQLDPFLDHSDPWAPVLSE